LQPASSLFPYTTLFRSLSLEGVSVLVVDDQEEARVVLTQALSEYGARVTAVSSGAEALALLSDPLSGKRPDALILDIAMPDEDRSEEHTSELQSLTNLV